METSGKQERSKRKEDGNNPTNCIASSSSASTSQSSRLPSSLNGNSIRNNGKDNFGGTNNNRNNVTTDQLHSHVNFGDRSRPTNGLSLPLPPKEAGQYANANSLFSSSHSSSGSGLLNTEHLDSFLDQYEQKYGLEPLENEDVMNLTTLESLLSLIKTRNSSYKEIASLLRDSKTTSQIQNLTSTSSTSKASTSSLNPSLCSRSAQKPRQDGGNLRYSSENGKVAPSLNVNIHKNPIFKDDNNADNHDDSLRPNKRKGSTAVAVSSEEIVILNTCKEQLPISNSNWKVNSDRTGNSKCSKMKTTVAVLKYVNSNSSNSKLNKGKSQEVNANRSSAAAKVDDDNIQIQPNSKNITSSTSSSCKTKKVIDSATSARININTEVHKLKLPDKKTSTTTTIPTQGMSSLFTPQQRRPQHIDNSKSRIVERADDKMRECARKLVTNRTFVKAPVEKEKAPSPPPTPTPTAIPVPTPTSTISTSKSTSTPRNSSNALMKSKIPIPLPKTKSKSVKEVVKATETSCVISSSAGAAINTSKPSKSFSQNGRIPSTPATASNNLAQQVEMETGGNEKSKKAEVFQRNDFQSATSPPPPPAQPRPPPPPPQKTEAPFEHLNPENSRVLHDAKASLSLVPSKKKVASGSGDELSETLDLIDGLSGHTSWVMKKLLEYPRSEQDLRDRLTKYLRGTPEIGEFFGVPYIKKEAKGHYFFGKSSLPSLLLKPPRL
ncbi:unnamed protein product [Orchesella dallaii]|uniref:Uncharacterized protein n=1 Tax=Orchesella dallaii TaxID=48710 RepID=A0ABP1QMM7_9HEXA